MYDCAPDFFFLSVLVFMHSIFLLSLRKKKRKEKRKEKRKKEKKKKEKRAVKRCTYKFPVIGISDAVCSCCLHCVCWALIGCCHGMERRDLVFTG